MINTKERYNEYLNSVDDVCIECALMSEEECERCPVRITVKQLEEYFERQKEGRPNDRTGDKKLTRRIQFQIKH